MSETDPRTRTELKRWARQKLTKEQFLTDADYHLTLAIVEQAFLHGALSEIHREIERLEGK